MELEIIPYIGTANGRKSCDRSAGRRRDREADDELWERGDERFGKSVHRKGVAIAFENHEEHSVARLLRTGCKSDLF